MDYPSVCVYKFILFLHVCLSTAKLIKYSTGRKDSKRYDIEKGKNTWKRIICMLLRMQAIILALQI